MRRPRPQHTRSWFELDHAKLAFLAFGAVEAIALVVYLLLGRGMWFWADEWDFLAGRTAGDPRDLFDPHGNVHPSTLPILVYRLFWNVWGAHSYRPYQVLIILLHLVCALLVRTVMRRAGVRPWPATVVASLFVLFGAGAQNILWPFQIGFVGSVVFGLAQLLLADHDGPFDRRDWLALLAGLAALLCSSIGIAMIVAVGAATLIRRGWRIALIQAVPLLLLYLLWWATLARPSYDLAREANPTSPGEVFRFMVDSVVSTFRELGQLAGVGVLLVAILIVGLSLAWGSLRGHELRARMAIPLALPLGAIVFLGLTGFGRAETGASDRGRYLYIVAALVLPALAVAADALIRRWMVLAPVVLALFVIGVPGNVHAAAEYTDAQRTSFLLFRRTQLTLPRLPAARQVPRSHTPQTGPHYHNVTIGWLLDAAAAGQLPEPRLVTRAGSATDNLRLVLSRYAKPDPAQRSANMCVALHDDQALSDIDLRLDTGQLISAHNVVIRLLPKSGPTGPAFPLELDGQSGLAFAVAIKDGTAFRARPKFTVADDARVCAPASAFTNPAALPAPSPKQRSPDLPRFCSAMLDIREFLAGLRLDEGKRPSQEAARMIRTRFLALLVKAERTAPDEVAASVDEFTQAIRASLFLGKHPSRQPAVEDGDRTILQFTTNRCG